MTISAPSDSEPGPVPARTRGVLRLIWSDYEAYSDLTAESRHARLLKAPVRFVINSSLRAQVLIRITCASPRWMHWFWRSMLVTFFSSEVVYGARIGPRLHVPHPYGIGIGGYVTIGSGVTICQHVTLGSDMTGVGQPRIGDGVIILAGAMVAGPITVGDDAVVGANSVLLEDLPPGGMCTPARTRIVKRRVAFPAPPPAAETAHEAEHLT